MDLWFSLPASQAQQLLSFHVRCIWVSIGLKWIRRLLTVCSLPVTAKALCTRLDTANPGLGVLVRFEVRVVMSQKSLSFSLQMILKEVDGMQEPANIDMLLPCTREDRLPEWDGICLRLRKVELRDIAIGVFWV